MTDLKDLELKPFKLADVPSELEWCIYPEERERGEVFLPKTAYMVVLALRWILTYTDHGLEEEFETWKVYWKNEDKYGFRTHIFLSREKVEQYDNWSDEIRVLQPQTWVTLATLSCNNGNGVIEEVLVPAPQPYGGEYQWHLNGVAGVQRLLEDAIYASDATHNRQPIHRLKDGWTHTWRVQGYNGLELDFKLEADHEYVESYVTGISLRTRKPSW
jgi:hypothetical protein